MSTSNMPARIWVDEVGGDFPVAYHRADIVERMAEALERAEELYQVGLLKAKDGLADQVVALRRSALNSYREASNDKA